MHSDGSPNAATLNLFWYWSSFLLNKLAPCEDELVMMDVGSSDPLPERKRLVYITIANYQAHRQAR